MKEQGPWVTPQRAQLEVALGDGKGFRESGCNTGPQKSPLDLQVNRTSYNPKHVLTGGGG